MLRISRVWVIFPVLLATGFGSVECLSCVPGCVASERVCSLPSCVISTSSESPVSLRSCLVDLGVSCDVAFFVLGFASLCKICSATVF